MGKLHTVAGDVAATIELRTMKRPASQPSDASRRPPEPYRPIPAQRAGVTLLAVRARRRRFRRYDLR